MGVRVRVGFKDSVGVQSGQKFPLGGFGAHGASGAFGAHGLLRAAPLAINYWPEAPGGGGVRGSSRPRTRGVAPPPPGPWQVRSQQPGFGGQDGGGQGSENFFHVL